MTQPSFYFFSGLNVQQHECCASNRDAAPLGGAEPFLEGEDGENESDGQTADREGGLDYR